MEMKRYETRQAFEILFSFVRFHEKREQVVPIYTQSFRYAFFQVAFSALNEKQSTFMYRVILD